MLCAFAYLKNVRGNYSESMKANMERIKEGHYRDENGQEYKSIWCYKLDEGFADYLNNNERNCEDAEVLKVKCVDKEWSDFNLSTNYPEGYLYNIQCLNEFYKDRPKKLKFTIRKK